MKETRIDRDAWFTEPDTVKDCMKIILDNIPNARYHEWFEPSAGSGAFLLEAIKQ